MKKPVYDTELACRIDTDVAEATSKEIKASGGKAAVCAGSVTDVEFPDRLVKTAAEAFGGIDIIVNNAGYTWDSVVQNITDEQWYAMIDVHPTAPFRIIRAATPYMREVTKQEIAEGKRMHCKIVNISSPSGVAGNAGQINYLAGKLGIGGVTKTMAKEWSQFNINVNAVAYGFIETRLTQPKEKQETSERGRRSNLESLMRCGRWWRASFRLEDRACRTKRPARCCSLLHRLQIT